MRDAYVGFYWTLPVNSHGFRSLPKDVDAAATSSRTIRYQRERVRQHLREQAGELIGEVAYMDSRPDRATRAVRDAMMKATNGSDAILLFVDFSQVRFWRRIPELPEYITSHGLRMYGLEPKAITIDGQLFDPFEHFEKWRQRDESAMGGFRLAAHAGLRKALEAETATSGRWMRIAERLNGEGVKTLRGGRWTPEGVRKIALRAHTDLLRPNENQLIGDS